MTVPHPELVAPTLTLEVRGIMGFAMTSGGLHIPWVPLGDVTVYVQEKAKDSTDFTDVASVPTDARGFYQRRIFAGVEYRAISQGVAGPPVVMPALNGPAVELPTPTLTLSLRGLLRHTVVIGYPVTATAKVAPLDMAGQRVRLTLQRRMAWKWVTRAAVPSGEPHDRPLPLHPCAGLAESFCSGVPQGLAFSFCG